jgi:hypothetical protein
MSIVINGSGTVTGLAVGGLPDGTVDAGTLATNSVDSAELIDGAVDSSHLASGVGGVDGISSSADATAITITSAEKIGINHTTPEARLEIDGGSETALKVTATVGGEYPAIFQSASTNSTPIADFRKSGGTTVLQVLSDGRGLSSFTAKAWWKMNGTGTPAFDASHNCSSITDIGTGHHKVNVANNMSSADYAALGNAGTTGNHQGLRTVNMYDYATNGVKFGTTYVDGTSQDVPMINGAIFGD